jgi:hypothetical protein
VCLSVSLSPLSTSEKTCRFLWTLVRWPWCHNFYCCYCNYSKVADVQISEVNEKLEPFNVGPWNFLFWYTFRGWTFLRKNEKFEYYGRWYLKLTSCFMATTHEPLYLDKRSLVQWKIVDMPTRLIWTIIFFNGPFEYGEGGNFILLRWRQNWHNSTRDHTISCADIFRWWTTCNTATVAIIQKYEYGRRLKVKIHILFYGENSWTVALSQMEFCRLKDHGHTYKFYLNHHFLWQSFRMWWYFEIMRLCWDKRWTTLCKIL